MIDSAKLEKAYETKSQQNKDFVTAAQIISELTGVEFKHDLYQRTISPIRNEGNIRYGKKVLDQLVEEGGTGQPDYRNEPFIWASLSSDSINLKALKEQGKTKQYLSEVTGVAFEYDPTFHSYVSTNLETLSLDAQNLGRGVIKELKDKNRGWPR